MAVGVQPADREEGILGVGVPTRDFGEVLDCELQGELGSGEGVLSIRVSSGGYPVPRVWISPLGLEDEVGEVPGNLGCREVIGESGPGRRDVMGIQMYLAPRVSAQQWRVPVVTCATGIWCPSCPSLPCHMA